MRSVQDDELVLDESAYAADPVGANTQYASTKNGIVVEFTGPEVPDRLLQQEPPAAFLKPDGKAYNYGEICSLRAVFSNALQFQRKKSPVF